MQPEVEGFLHATHTFDTVNFYRQIFLLTFLWELTSLTTAKQNNQDYQAGSVEKRVILVGRLSHWQDWDHCGQAEQTTIWQAD